MKSCRDSTAWQTASRAHNACAAIRCGNRRVFPFPCNRKFGLLFDISCIISSYCLTSLHNGWLGMFAGVKKHFTWLVRPLQSKQVAQRLVAAIRFRQPVVILPAILGYVRPITLILIHTPDQPNTYKSFCGRFTNLRTVSLAFVCVCAVCRHPPLHVCCPCGCRIG